MDIVGPDKDIMEVVKRVLDQNEKILNMNADLLAKLANPLVIRHPDLGKMP